MKSFTIKLTDNKIRDDLLEELEKINLTGIYISDKNFKYFKNIIIHYTGNEIISFRILFSEVIANVIQKEYDMYFINKIILKNYFYVSNDEQEAIKKISRKILISSREDENLGKEILKNLVFEYFLENKSMILEGFINFRIKEYLKTLDYIVELSVMSYLNIMI